MICKIEPQFVNESIKKEVKKMIERKLEEAIENLVNQWLNKGNWLERKFCNFVSVSINKSPHGYDCLKTGQMGGDKHLRKDIKQLVNSLNGSGEMNIEIGEWWLAGRWKQSNKKWGRKDGQNDVRGVTEKLLEFSGSVGQLRESTLKKAVKELVEEFEKGIIKRREGFCGVWNEGVTCPEGGVVI
ncbi:hypothetical protein [Mycoplasma parvum]|uniref:Uncharacterized protein n=1 Tax=Mycoplasma parvum str. Indiana TaxID=1403316 RepID=U5NBM1_9MOLU|nr:hypothetical protein [Mycoplasma parvum]AGX88951.1 hypothetical protein PRV_00930 [Mycoplasma parvum str. Indiana]